MCLVVYGGYFTEPDSMTKCGRAFVGATAGKYSGFGKDILLGSCLVITTMDIEEINSDRDNSWLT